MWRVIIKGAECNNKEIPRKTTWCGWKSPEVGSLSRRHKTKEVVMPKSKGKDSITSLIAREEELFPTILIPRSDQSASMSSKKSYV